MRFSDVYERKLTGRLTAEEAADILGVSARTVRRWCTKYEEEGAQGLVDGRLGKVSHKCAPVDEIMQLLELFETKYFDFNTKHFHQKYQFVHGSIRSYTWTKNMLQAAGKIPKTKGRGKHRKKRPRKPLVGMMLHQDASMHEWVPGIKWDLIVTMDDATSEIYSAFFVDEEGTMSSLTAIQEVIEKKGLFNSLYTDRGTHYWLTRKADDKVDYHAPTQVHRALKQLGIQLIPAYSPEARGRSERMFKTLQGRLPQELRVAGITEMHAANHYLRQVLLPELKALFTIQAEEEGSTFVPWIGGNEQLADILSVQEDRVVGKDNTVRYENTILQIPADKYRYHYVKATIKVHKYPDEHLAVFHGPRLLARYNADGSLQIREAITREVMIC